MINKYSLPLQGFIYALLAAIYIAAVSQLLGNSSGLFGPVNSAALAPTAFLLVFVLSAAIMALLIFGKPAMLYVDGQKKEAVKLVSYTIGSLFVLTLLFFALILA